MRVSTEPHRISCTYAACPESPLSTFELGGSTSRLWFSAGGRVTRQQVVEDLGLQEDAAHQQETSTEKLAPSLQPLGAAQSAYDPTTLFYEPIAFDSGTLTTQTRAGLGSPVSLLNR